MIAFGLRIVTPTGELYSGTVDHVSLNTPDGRAGFMRGALPRVAVLAAGTVKITVDGTVRDIECGDGLYCIDKNGMTIITSAEDAVTFSPKPVQSADDSDCARLKYARARIESNMVKMKGKNYPDETF